VGLATGCSDPDPPGTLPKTSPVPVSSTASPSLTPSTPAQQVEAAVRTYYAHLTRASVTNDTRVLKTLTVTACPCYRAVQVIDAGAARGERAPDAKWNVDTVRVHDVIDTTAAAEVHYRVTGYDVLSSSGKVLAHIDPQTSHLDLSLVKTGHGWVITNAFDLNG
jgi:hypothetical protein